MEEENEQQNTQVSERETPLDNRTEVCGVRHTQIEVKEFGKTVKVGPSYHSKTNHYIKQSRNYFPGKKLYLYINFCFMLKLAFLTWLFCFFGALSRQSEHHRWAPAYCFIPVVIWVAVFSQHEVVSRKTMHDVLKQPVIPEQRSLNSFYRVTVQELSGVALANYQEGLGYLKVSSGQVEFQAFNSKAVVLMKKAMCYSRLFLFLFIVSAGYNMYFLVKYSFHY